MPPPRIEAATISWSDIFLLAKDVSSESKINRPTLILGILENESSFTTNLGSNTGSRDGNIQRCVNFCDSATCKRDGCDSCDNTPRRPIRRLWCTAHQTDLEKIVSEAKELRETAAEVPIAPDYGMGPAQFQPGTWKGYPGLKGKNPWYTNDAVRAIGYFLNGHNVNSNELGALKAYNGGKNYSKTIIQLAQEWEIRFFSGVSGLYDCKNISNHSCILQGLSDISKSCVSSGSVGQQKECIRKNITDGLKLKIQRIEQEKPKQPQEPKEKQKQGEVKPTEDQRLEITTLVLKPSTATVNTPYSSELIVATGGKTPHTWRLYQNSSPLPPGLSINKKKGVIEGVPTTVGTYNFFIEVKDSSGFLGINAMKDTQLLTLPVREKEQQTPPPPQTPVPVPTPTPVPTPIPSTPSPQPQPSPAPAPSATNHMDMSVDGNLTIARGETGTKPVTANISAWEGKSATFTVQGLPTGASGKFSPPSCDRFCNATLTIITSPTTPMGHYEIDVTATRETNNDSARFTLQIGWQTKPSAPGNLQATPLSSTEISLAWNDNANNEQIIRIELKTRASGTFDPDHPIFNQRVSNKTSYTDTGLQPSTEYCYRVYVANDDTDQSDYSHVACATTQAGAPSPPAPKPDLIITSITAPSSGTIGGYLNNVSITFKNQGQGDITPGRFRTAFFWSTDSAITQNDVASGEILGFTQGIPAGESRTVSVTNVPIPSSLVAGAYYLGAITDYYDEIDEGNDEGNNSAASASSVSLTIPVSGPKLLSPEDSSTIAVESGSFHTFTWESAGYVNIKFWNGANCEGKGIILGNSSSGSYQWQFTGDYAKGQTYSWQVIKYVNGTPSYSACRSFLLAS